MPRLYRLARPASEAVLSRHTKEGDPRLERSLHMDRDGDAFLQVSCALEGHQYADTMYDWPGGFFSIHDSTDRLEAAGLSPLQQLALANDDLVLVTTRPALDDQDDDPQGSQDRTGTPIEARLFAAVQPFFAMLKRREVILHREFDISGREGWGHHRHLEVATRGPAWIISKKEEQVAAGYAAYEPSWTIPLDGTQIQTRLLVVFGMDGTTGLCWAHLLRRRLGEQLRALVDSVEPTLLVGEFSFRMAGPQLPLTGDFVRSFEHRTIQVRRGPRLR